MPERNNQTWVRDLQSTDTERENALADLHATLLRVLPSAVTRWLSPDDPALETLVEDVAQETLLRVMDKLNTFEGRSQFTTWVYKIAVRIALTELRRERWKDVSLDEMTDGRARETEPGFVSTREPGPESASEQRDALRLLQRIVSDELTGKQRQAMNAIGVQGLPLEEVARRMGANRNALYKLMHDARLRLKSRLDQEGLPIEDLLAMFGL
ncbi:MAG: sigma-70 family RNA polymerase sigma factor [Chloroflexi bacterium]|nr:sigma-70 family RNA polymerase sigma factor [Chloroflexota bacterium]